MSEEAKGIFNTLGNIKNLPHIPNSIMQLQQTLTDPDASPRAIANHLKSEPVMATQLLKIAENLRKSRNPQNPPIISIEHAVVYIGFKSVKDLVLAASLRTFKIPESKFHVENYWAESLLTGSITEYLARKFSIPLPEDQLFLAGSLCNIGKLVLAMCFPGLVTKIITDISSPETLGTWQMAEIRYQFPSHTILGEIAAALWGLPDFVMQSARKHHDKMTSKGNSLEIWEIAGVANQLTHWIFLEPHRIDAPFLQDFCSRYKLSENELEKLVVEIEKKFSQASKAVA